MARRPKPPDGLRDDWHALLKTLKLPTILREHAKVATACEADRADYAAYLLCLAEREVADRERRAAQRRVKAAKFPALKTLDTFDFAAQPSLNQPLIRELMTSEYIERHENVLLLGNSYRLRESKRRLGARSRPDDERETA